MRKLTGLPINYLITVNFHGFKQIVDKLGGVWLDIDRRYYNKNDGSAATNFAEHQPPARLPAAERRQRARVRPLPPHRRRLPPARAPAAVRAGVQGAGRAALRRPQAAGIVTAITHNVEVGAKTGFNERTVLAYALLAATLPGGHLFQVKIEGVDRLRRADRARRARSQSAVQQFENPDVGVVEGRERRRARHASRRRRRRRAPKDTTITVLNGNGVAGAAANASYLLAQRGYITLLPPGNAQPNAPTQDYFHSQIYFDPSADRARRRRRSRSKKLVEPADVKPLPKDPALRALDPGAMLLFVAGSDVPQRDQRAAPAVEVPKQQPPNVRYDAAPGRELLEQYRGKVPFKLMVPTVLERSSHPDPAYGDTPVAALLDRRRTTRRSGSSSAPAPTSTGASRRPTGTTRRCSPTGASGTGSRAATTTSTTRASTCTWSCCGRAARPTGS